nr:MAG TPA: hypothetical protein [Caudoviricetes sp.]
MVDCINVYIVYFFLIPFACLINKSVFDNIFNFHDFVFRNTIRNLCYPLFVNCSDLVYHYPAFGVFSFYFYPCRVRLGTAGNRCYNDSI